MEAGAPYTAHATWGAIAWHYARINQFGRKYGAPGPILAFAEQVIAALAVAWKRELGIPPIWYTEIIVIHDGEGISRLAVS